jgi:hypothetical protein
MASLDVVGHEFTHGITWYEAALIYQGESGALNESFSDIFGVMVERHISGLPDWIIGEDFSVGFRSFQNPNDFGDPDTFAGINWVNPNDLNNDFGGVHSNSGVQNHWFFLLANGGVGTNDLGQAFNVQGIGIIDAARIAHRNLTTYMQPGSTFADARVGSLNAAIDLFGECSPQHASTAAAWQAVGIGNAFQLCASNIHPAFTQFCVEDNTFNTTFSISVFPANAIVQWFFPPTWDFTIMGTTLILNDIQFPQSGTYQVTAQVTANNESAFQTSVISIEDCGGYEFPEGAAR